MTLLINILLGIYVFVALLMVLVILMQRPKSEGLGAAFGGGVTENIFGAQTTNVLTKITSWLAAFFFLLTFGLSILYAHKSNTKSELGRELMKGLPPGAATGTPTPSPGASATASPPNTVTSPAAASSTAPAASVKPAGLAESALSPTSSSVAPSSGPGSSAGPTGSPGRSDTPLVPVKRKPGQ